MDLQRAQSIAKDVIERLQPHCRRIEVAGSIRRKKLLVNDIDFVLIPSDHWQLQSEIMRLGGGQVKMSGSKITRLYYLGAQVDIYFADTVTWATLLLIRTGSKESNIRLASLAQKKGWHLHASGAGLFNENSERIAGDTEQSIFEALGIPYQEPEKRG